MEQRPLEQRKEHSKKPNIMKRAMHRLNLFNSVGHYGRTMAKYEIEPNNIRFYWHEYYLNELTNKLEYAELQTSVPKDALVTEITNFKSYSWGTSDTTFKNENRELGLSISIDRYLLFFGNAFIYQYVVNSKQTIGTGLDMGIRDFRRLCKKIEVSI